MNKKIIIENFSPLTYKHQLAIIAEYMRLNEIAINSTCWHNIFDDKKVKISSKYDTKIKLGWQTWNVICRETKTSYIFNIFKANN